jgi:hypothetical protein
VLCGVDFSYATKVDFVLRRVDFRYATEVDFVPHRADFKAKRTFGRQIQMKNPEKTSSFAAEVGLRCGCSRLVPPEWT